MSHEFTSHLTVEQMYGDWDLEWEDLVEIADQSLSPRERTSIYDTVATLGMDDNHHVLDIGGRDATQALDLAERFGCRVLSVDPVALNLRKGAENIAKHDLGHLVENAYGTINDIPAADDSFDLIFSRDMMGHVEDLAGALVECRRVLKPRGAMVIHDVFETSLLEPQEKQTLSAGLAQVPERLDGQLFERTLSDAGFEIESSDPVGSEWLESSLEREDGEKRLLRAARLNRNRDRLVAEMGAVPYRVFQANNLWTIYRMIGKLEDRVYVVRALEKSQLNR